MDGPAGSVDRTPSPPDEQPDSTATTTTGTIDTANQRTSERVARVRGAAKTCGTIHL
ncbi:hypothetical protein GCM10010428_32770 [Actinosynnema pretiosum subsp. pretiosum]